MKNVILGVLLVLSISSCSDRTKIELQNGKGELKEVSTLGLKNSDFNFDDFLFLARMSSSFASSTCAHYLTYEPSYAAFSIWGKEDTKSSYGYVPKKETFIITVSFTAKNSFGVEDNGMNTYYFQAENNKYKSVTKEILKYTDAKTSEEIEKEMGL
jgi:hypothetical protein